MFFWGGDEWTNAPVRNWGDRCGRMAKDAKNPSLCAIRRMGGDAQSFSWHCHHRQPHGSTPTIPIPVVVPRRDVPPERLCGLTAPVVL